LSGKVLLFYTERELALIVAVGVYTGLIDHQINSILFALIAHIHSIVLFNDYIQHVTGGPLFGDLLQTWLEYGGVLAACLVRKPASGTFALTVNGFCQVFVYGTHDPHLWYGLAGLGADIVFALFKYKRYDFPVICLAGILSGVFWYSIVWFTHGIYLYPVSFIISDFGIRVLGNAVGDGLLGAAMAFVILKIASRRWSDSRPPTFELSNFSKSFLGTICALILGSAILSIVLTYDSHSVEEFFQSIGPKIAGGIPYDEEYNPGYVFSILLIFLVLVIAGFWILSSRVPRNVRGKVA